MNNERLTQWVGDGASLILDNPKNELEARQQLMEKYKKAVIKLAKFEDAVENGIYIKLPCKVGDTIYYVSPYRPTKIIVPVIVKAFRIDIYENELTLWAILGGDNDYLKITGNKDVFFSHEDAEKRLKELQDRNDK